MKRMVAVCALIATAALAGGEAHADLKSGIQKLTEGDYKGARRDLGQVKGSDRGWARLSLGRLDVLTGNYGKAEKTAKSLTRVPNKKIATEARVFLAEVMRLRGRLGEARRQLEPQALKNKSHLRTRYVLALIYHDLGKKKLADATFEQFYDDFNAGKINDRDAGQLFYVAEAARYLARYDDSNGMFRDAVDRDARLLDANLEWGKLFLQKYSPGNAKASFDEVLKINPHHPDAHAGMAAAKLEASYNIADAMHHIDQALAVNSKHMPALLVRAGIEIDQNHWEQAKKTLELVFEQNPNNLEGRSLLATIFWLRDDLKAYETQRKLVLAQNPRYAMFFHIIARSAEREHRYDKAIELEKEGVKIAPDFFVAMQAIGTGYMRLGEEKKGLEWLKRAWAGDEYNQRTLNTLTLFDDTIPKEYSFQRTKNFKIRYHNDEKAVLSRYVEPLLETAFADMVKRYDFKPKTPVILELFKDTEDYSVRTVGLPNLGALGVCFGQVITALAPSVGDINWSMILWHELSHVFAIQLSNSRVPRWYTEGLSEYETILARPEWRRENDSDLYAALQEGTLPSVVELNPGFVKPDMQQVVVAYHLSSVTIEYIAVNYGFPVLVEGLKLFAKGLETPEVIEKITGRKVAQFDAEFRKYLTKRLARYKGTFQVPSGHKDVKKLEIAAAAAPKSVTALAALALGHFYDGNTNGAEAAATAALKLDPNHKIALYVSAELSVRGRDLDRAKELYERLIKVGADSYDIRARLSLIAERSGDEKKAIAHLCTAKKLDPERSYPYQELFRLYGKAGDKVAALQELETFVMLEQMQYSPIKKLIDGYYALANWKKVTYYGQMAVNINPHDSALMLQLGTAYLKTKEADKALFTFDTALLIRPELRRPALGHIGRARALLAQGNKRLAAKAVTKALSYEPDNAEALDLKKTR